jgi:hypothetical protein
VKETMMDRVLYLPTEKRTRLSVSCDDALVDIADEDCTSDTCREALRDPASVTRVCMTREHAAWLRDALVALDLGPSPVTVAPVERTPEIVLRAMLRAYEAALLDAHAAYMCGERTFEAARRVDRLAADTVAVRYACAWVIAGHNDDVDLREHRLADYRARLRGDRPLDAPPLEVP